MKTVKLESLTPGSITEVEYLSDTGEVLLSKGVELSVHHIELLQRRNISELYVKANEEVDEIQKILSTELESLDDLDFNDSELNSELKNDTEGELTGRPKAMELPIFKDIKAGQAGFEQLIKSKKATSLDQELQSGKTSDRPIGTALKDSIKECSSQRTDEYKSEISTSYDKALNDTKIILNTLVNGETIDGAYIRKIVERIVKTFIMDNNILLNLSNSRSKDNIYLYNHSLNVCLLSINIATSFGYSQTQVVEIGMGSLLSDIGMLLLPMEILKKQGKLTRDEWFEVQKHPIMGLHLLENILRLPDTIPYIAYQSHERENGIGYPKKRSKRFIHGFSKIVQIADIFIALSSPRPYREEYIPYKAMEFIIKMTKQGLISGEFVKAFLCYSSLFPVGSLVQLNDNSIAKVIKANDTSFAKPIVSVITNSNNELLPKNEISQINLRKNTDFQIIKALKSDHLPQLSIMDGF